MKLPAFLSIHAIVLLAVGIAFALYSPLMLAFFAVPDLATSAETYWHIAAFARMFGAGLFGLGLLIWALRNITDSLPPASRRSLLAALLLADLMSTFVAITQQSAIWLTPAGWIVTGFFGFFTAICVYFLVTQPAQKGA